MSYTKPDFEGSYHANFVCVNGNSSILFHGLPSGTNCPVAQAVMREGYYESDLSDPDNPLKAMYLCCKKPKGMR